MSISDINKMYEEWIRHPLLSEDLKNELIAIAHDEDAIRDRFYRRLAFGTGGLRARMGAGTNRMNPFTIAKATYGFAAYLKQQNADPSCAVAFDSRNNSTLFSEIVAAVLASEGVRVYRYQVLTPTPMLSFAVRYLHCDGGVMITASHNPAPYNGYKVYGPDGCQITTTAADMISSLIDLQADLPLNLPSFQEESKRGKVHTIGEEVFSAYYEAVLKESVLMPEHELNVVYTPLNGTGLKPIKRVLSSLPGVHVKVVPEQEQPDGFFPTCPSPNPETREAMELAVRMTESTGADICLATDPDCDRVGVGVRTKNGVQLMNGNEIGILLFHFICESRLAKGSMPMHPVAVKTIVTTPMAQAIADHYHVDLRNVLTGFKFIGEQIAGLELEHRQNDYIFGFEESYGYLSGTYVRDKDAVNACMLICEMASYYLKKGANLVEVYAALQDRYGFYTSDLLSFAFEGEKGMYQMAQVMEGFRGIDHVDDRSISKKTDYLRDETGLPQSDVIAFDLSDGTHLVVRPSGTEPKLKLYLTASSDTAEKSALSVERLKTSCNELIKRLS